MGVSFNLCGPSLIFLFFSFFFALILEKNDVYESPQVYLIDLLVLRCGSLSCPLVMFMVKLSKVGVPLFPFMDFMDFLSFSLSLAYPPNDSHLYDPSTPSNQHPETPSLPDPTHSRTDRPAIRTPIKADSVDTDCRPAGDTVDTRRCTGVK